MSDPSGTFGRLDVVAMFAHDSFVHTRNPAGRFWPSALQERLLRVALEDPEAAGASWQELRPHFSLDELERGSFELLPMIYRNLTRSGHEDPLLPRLKGIYRKTWVTNNLLVERTRDLGDALRDAGIRALFIEGVMVARRFYPELGLRPSSSVDVLVDDRDAAAALDGLAHAGWHERPGSAKGSGVVRHLFDRGGNVCVLRTRLAIDFVARNRQGHAHTPLWEAAEWEDIGGLELLVPAPTDTLLAVCVSHARAEGAPDVQWIADAKAVLEAEIDWERLLEIGFESQQGLRLRNAFRYLANLPGPSPPRFALERLTGAKTGGRERLVYLCTAGSIRGAGAMPLLVGEHLAATARESSLRTIATFPGHLGHRWSLSWQRQVPLAAGRRAIRLLTGRRKRAS